MGKCNLAVNQLLERKEIFSDLINGALFEGKEYIKPQKLKIQPTHTGIMMEKEKNKMAALERYGDIRMGAGIFWTCWRLTKKVNCRRR